MIFFEKILYFLFMWFTAVFILFIVVLYILFIHMA